MSTIGIKSASLAVNFFLRWKATSLFQESKAVNKNRRLCVSLYKAHLDQSFAQQLLLTAHETPLNSKDGIDAREQLSLQSG